MALAALANVESLNLSLFGGNVSCLCGSWGDNRRTYIGKTESGGLDPQGLTSLASSVINTPVSSSSQNAFDLALKITGVSKESTQELKGKDMGSLQEEAEKIAPYLGLIKGLFERLVQSWKDSHARTEGHIDDETLVRAVANHCSPEEFRELHRVYQLESTAGKKFGDEIARIASKGGNLCDLERDDLERLISVAKRVQPHAAAVELPSLASLAKFAKHRGYVQVDQDGNLHTVRSWKYKFQKRAAREAANKATYDATCVLRKVPGAPKVQELFNAVADRWMNEQNEEEYLWHRYQEGRGITPQHILQRHRGQAALYHNWSCLHQFYSKYIYNNDGISVTSFESNPFVDARYQGLLQEVKRLNVPLNRIPPESLVQLRDFVRSLSKAYQVGLLKKTTPEKLEFACAYLSIPFSLSEANEYCLTENDYNMLNYALNRGVPQPLNGSEHIEEAGRLDAIYEPIRSFYERVKFDVNLLEMYRGDGRRTVAVVQPLAFTEVLRLIEQSSVQRERTSPKPLVENERGEFKRIFPRYEDCQSILCSASVNTLTREQLTSLIRVIENGSEVCFRSLRVACEPYIEGDDSDGQQFQHLLHMACIYSGQDVGEMNLKKFLTEDVFIALKSNISQIGPYLSGINQFMVMLGDTNVSYAELRNAFPKMEEVFTAELKSVFERSRLDVLRISSDHHVLLREVFPSISPKDYARELLSLVYNSVFRSAQDFREELLHKCVGREFQLNVAKVLSRHPLAETIATKNNFQALEGAIPEAKVVYFAAESLHRDLSRCHFQERASGFLELAALVKDPGESKPLQRKEQGLLTAVFKPPRNAADIYSFLREDFESGARKYFDRSEVIKELCKAVRDLHFYLQEYLISPRTWSKWERDFSVTYTDAQKQCLVSVAAAWLGKAYRYDSAEALLTVEDSQAIVVCIERLYRDFPKMERAFKVLKTNGEGAYRDFDHALEDHKSAIKAAPSLDCLERELLNALLTHSIQLEASPRGGHGGFDGNDATGEE